MIRFLDTLFSWPDGIVVGNLIASGICVSVAAVHLDRLARKHHKAHLALMHKHHRELMEKTNDN
jgi:hypothetical protein